MESVVFNKCQTPIEELELDKCPKEVQEQFWDYLNNVPFIRWMVSPDRPLISELPRDEEGKAIFDITAPPILEDTDYFRRTAKNWQETGRYIQLRPNRNPQSDYGKWLYGERDRSWNGLINPNTGMRITGDQYFFLNYCPIQLIRKDSKGKDERIIDFPDFWDGHFLMYNYIEQGRLQGHHAAMLASRGKGKSYSGAGMLAKRCVLGESERVKRKVQCVVTAADRKYIYGANQILNMFCNNLDFLATNTQFASHRLIDSVQSLNWVMGYKDKFSGVRHGSGNSVMGITSGDDQSKLNGSRGVLYLVEEAGIFKNLMSLYQMIRPSVEDGSSVYGQIYLYGTAGDDMSDFTSLQEIMYNPRGYNMLPLSNVYDKEGQGRTEFTFFFPAYLNRANCMDKDGNSDVTKALLEILLDRYNVKYNSTDINAITKRISQYPITPQEAIVRSTGSIFPVTELNERLNQLDHNPSEYDDVWVGDLIQDIDTAGNNGKFEYNGVKFMPSAKQPIRDFPLKDNKMIGAIEIYNMPQKSPDGQIPYGRYIAGADPYDNDVANSKSLGSILMLDTWTDTIVMEYTGRPMFADEYYEICRLACLFYNATLLYEQNKKGLFSYFSQRNSTHLLADTPEYLLDKQLIKGIGYGNTRKGVTTTAPIKNFAFGLIRDWLLKSSPKIVKNEAGEDIEITISNLFNLRGRALVKELILYNANINVDRIMALAMLMIYREEKMIILQGDLSSEVSSSSGLEEDDYFTRNYPGSNREITWWR